MVNYQSIIAPIVVSVLQELFQNIYFPLKKFF